MAPLTRLLSSILLAAGIVFLLAGMTAAMGSTLVSFGAGIAAITALLYAGSVWFGAPPAVLAGSARETVWAAARFLRHY